MCPGLGLRGTSAQRLARTLTYLVEAHGDQLFHQALWWRTVDREVESAFGHRVSAQLISKLFENRTAERRVTQVVLERGEACDDLAPNAERGNTVRDHLLSFRDDLKDHPAQRLKGSALRLSDRE